ncbi:sarcosine oxidase [Thermocatellispora tengchongensis]|uniref:Sarcosine oxidase n=1 Tax=Thermocatellispora tengchongensis TaxID=1073253 RepID=A0A840PC84_9ACTN|nr:N-methyl-L-tryptophan oxidase [Thermocatellispora tengchongensis]MBB5135451.1 sarcosine oxidase [Thermocatellispora tengchongensis]
MAAFDAGVAVIGLGAWGSAALWSLARRGVRAVGIERFTPGHAFGSSHGGTRMFRTACLEHPDLVPLAQRSARLWRELEAETGRRLFEPTGGVLIGPRDGHIVSGTLAAAREHALPVEVWDAGRLRRELPQHGELPDHHCGVWEPAAGLLRPEAAIRAALDAAAGAGAQVYPDTRVTGIEPVDGGVVVHTPTRDLRVEQAVVTAGPWLPALVPGLPLEAVRMPVTWFRAGDSRAADFALARLPVFIRELDDGQCVWGHGAEDDGLVKVGLEDSGGRFEVIDPDACDRSVRPEDWTLLADRLTTALPGLGALPSKAAVCMFTRSPDKQFLVGRPRGDRRLVIAGGCSGHGFKHATGVGEIVADLVTGKPPSCPAAFMDPDRFL